MYKAYIEPDLASAHIQVANTVRTPDPPSYPSPFGGHLACLSALSAEPPRCSALPF